MRLISYMSPGFPESLFTRVGELVDADLEFETEMSGPAPGTDPFVGTEPDADLGWICSTSFVDLGTRGTNPSVQLVGVAWVPDDPDANGRPVYFGDVVTRPDSGIESFENLSGCRFACNDLVSLSGHYSVKFALRDRGLPEDFFDITFTGGHHHSLDALIAGDADAAVVDSVVRTSRARQDPAVAELSIIERLGPWPTQPLVARATMSQSEVAEVRRLLLNATTNDQQLQAELSRSALSHLIEVDSDHYAAVHAAMTDLD